MDSATAKPRLKEIIDTLPQTGTLEWIGLRPKKRATMESVDQATVSLESGLEGDHYQGRSKNRQLTLIQKEHLQTVAQLLGIEEAEAALARRNLVVSGINLLAFKDRQFRIGEVILEMTGYCYPCTRMEENFGPGGYNAMRGHGGINAKVISGGRISVGDKVSLVQ